VTIVGGDALCLSIAAASIVAKHHRDQLMIEADAAHPGYGWASNKGYGCPHHRDALNRLGPTPLHRRSFAPVAQALLPL
jgi:ribonuclease HII